MKKYLIFLAILAATITYAQKTSEKVVVINGGKEVGRYIGENSTKYHISVHDEGWITKKGNKVVLYSAANGQGIIFPKNFGTVNVRQSPNISASIIGKIISNEGELPDVYECLGLKNGWFKTKINGRLGYVKADHMEWDSINTF